MKYVSPAPMMGQYTFAACIDSLIGGSQEATTHACWSRHCATKGQTVFASFVINPTQAPRPASVPQQSQKHCQLWALALPGPDKLGMCPELLRLPDIFPRMA